MSCLRRPTTFSIPKIIHFIGAGGDRAMPQKNIEAVIQWKQQNPTFDVWLWVDKESTSPAKRKIFLCH